MTAKYAKIKEVKDVPFYPVNLQITNRSCMIVGGGHVAARKVSSLLAAGACVSVLSPELIPTLAELVGEKKLIHIARSYQAGDVTGFFIVICATSDAGVNRLAAEEAIQAGSLVNVADAPELGNFSVPSQILQGDLLMTISTGGKSPALAKMLSLELRERYGPEYGEYLNLIATVREKMKKELASSTEREAFWRRTIDREVINLLRNGKVEEAEARIYNAISCSGTES